MIMSFLRSTILRKPSLVEHADVAGAEIAVGREGGGIGLRLLPVALHHLRALGADFARLADRRFPVVGVEQLDVGRRERQAHRRREASARHRRIEVRIGEVSERP